MKGTVEPREFVYHRQGSQVRENGVKNWVENMSPARLVKLGLVSVLLTSTTYAAAAQQDAPTIDEWTVPWENSRPRDPYVDSAGMVWFVGQRSHYVASLNPETGSFRQLTLDPGTGPHNLIVDGDHTIWYAPLLAWGNAE